MMQSKLVENWLTSCGELTYTTPFVQLLITEGYEILRAHGGQDEQGKDVIARNPEGEICCFQLKCGNIKVPEWAKINGQINDLTQLPPVHSSFKEAPKKWKCYLVTNGIFASTAQRTIVDYSKQQEANGHMPVETIDKDQLVSRFTKSYGRFFPTETNDLNLFLNIYCRHGDSTLNREEFKLFFENFLSAYSTESGRKKLEALQAAGIICSYLLANKYLLENHIEIINAWVLVLVTVLYFANEWNISEKSVSLIETTILDEIENVSGNLIKDFATDTKHLVDTSYGFFSEGIAAHRLRCMELIGYISAYLNYCKTRPVDTTSSFTEEAAQKFLNLAANNITIIGEGSTSLIYSYIAFVYSVNSRFGAIEIASLLNGLLAAYADEGLGIPSPYYTSQQSIEWLYSLNSDEVTESFQNRAYCLWPAVLLAARCELRPLLQHHWPLISYIANQEVVPDKPNDLLLWKIKDGGKLLDTYPNTTQSWSDLVQQSQQDMNEFLPSPLRKRKYLIPLWLIAMPHRVTHKTVLSMFKD